MSNRQGKGGVEIRQGYLKFHRAGNLKFIDQSHWTHAPAPKGLWAFPYPFFDEGYICHKYNDHVPKHLREKEGYSLSLDEWEEREKWVIEHGLKILKPKKFWYSGYLYSRMSGMGQPHGIDENGDDEDAYVSWSFMHTSQLYKLLKSGGDRGWEIHDNQKKIVRYSVDHLEVFIPPNYGTLREGVEPPKK